MGCEAKQPSRGEREVKHKWRIHLLLTRCCLVTSAFCRLPLPLAPDGSMWLLKINHPPGRGVGEREEVEMVEEENVFAVPALQHHGDAGKGALPQGGERAVTSSASMLGIILAFAPSCRLQLRDEQEVTSTQIQICQINYIRKAFGLGLPVLTQVIQRHHHWELEQPGASLSRRVRKSAQCANHVQPLDETPAFWALLFIGRALVNIIAAMYLPCQITANRQHLPCSGKRTAKETGIWKL